MKSRLLIAALVSIVAGAGLAACDTTQKQETDATKTDATKTTDAATVAPDTTRDYQRYGYYGTVRGGDLGRLGGGNIGGFGNR